MANLAAHLVGIIVAIVLLFIALGGMALNMFVGDVSSIFTASFC